MKFSLIPILLLLVTTTAYAQNAINVRTGNTSTTHDSTYACSGSTIFFCVPDTATGNSYQWQVDMGAGFTNVSNEDYDGSLADTLMLTGFPTSYYGYKYRCIITNNSVSTISGEQYLIIQSEWTGAVSNAWDDAANWSCNVVPDANTDVVIKYIATFQPIVNSNAFCRGIRLEPATNVIINGGFLLYSSGKNL